MMDDKSENVVFVSPTPQRAHTHTHKHTRAHTHTPLTYHNTGRYISQFEDPTIITS